MIELEVPAGRKATRAVVATDEGATGLSRLVDPEARREAEKGLLDRLPLDWIGRVFTPNALLDAAPPRLLEFGQLLNLIAEAPVDRLDPADVPTLLRALNVSRYLDAVSMPTAAMSREEREALRAFKMRTVGFHKADFLHQLQQAEASDAAGGRLPRTGFARAAVDSTGVTELLGFLQCFALDADLARVRDLEARAQRELAAAAAAENRLDKLTLFEPCPCPYAPTF
jgi:hypothetical protein